MINKQTETNLQLVEEARVLRSSVISLSEPLPKTTISAIQFRLNQCLDDLPQHIEDGLATNKKIERIKSLVLANGNLNECQDYLTALRRLRYYEPDEISDTLAHLRKKINNRDLITAKTIN